MVRLHMLIFALLVLLPRMAEAEPAQAWTGIRTNDTQVEQLAAQLKGNQAEAALTKLIDLANQDHGDALFALARAYAVGQGVKASQDRAEQYLQQGMEQGNANCFVAQAVIAETAGENDALFYYTQAAEQQQPLAMLRLGRCYEHAQLGLGRNVEQAAQFYRRAHEAGNPVAAYELGRCYREGVGVSEDATSSTRFIRIAADAGVATAQRAMSVAYDEGYGIAQDKVAAVGWLLLAAQHGDRDALVLLGLRFERGIGVRTDYNQAGQYYSVAAKNGDQIAHYRLAMLYINGHGTKPDPVRGYVLLQRVRKLPPAAKAIKQLEASMNSEQLAMAKRKAAQHP